MAASLHSCVCTVLLACWSSRSQRPDVCFCLQSLALAHANIDNDMVFLDKW